MTQERLTNAELVGQIKMYLDRSAPKDTHLHLAFRHEQWRQIISALTSAGVLREGWKLVPIEPTDEMITACGKAMAQWIDGLSPEERGLYKGKPGGTPVPPKVKARVRYQAMIAASPPTQPKETRG